MRIVGGKYGGRHLPGPKGATTRPTSERVREAIASLLDARHAIRGARVLELYAGTGALGFEMLSRGASHVLFVEREPAMAAALRASATELGAEAETAVLRADVEKPKTQADILQRGPFSLVLADPPYRDAQRAMDALATLCGHGLVADGALLLLETSAKEVPALPDGFTALSKYRYGDTAVALFERGGEVR